MSWGSFCLRESCWWTNVDVTFSSGEEEKKNRTDRNLCLYTSAFARLLTKRPTNRKRISKNRLLRRQTSKITNIYWKIEYWLLIEWHLILIMPSLLVRLFLFTYQKDRLPVDHAEVQQTYNVQLNREGKRWKTKHYFWYSTHLFGVCWVSLHICARHNCPLLFRCLCKGCYVAPRYLITILRKLKSCIQRWTFIDIIDH